VCWLGPAIGQQAFEVGPEVRDAFLRQDAADADAFVAGIGDRWHADLLALARRRLAAIGVHRCHGGDWCTWSDPARFHSYRRDRETGRMATLIWMER
jgi:polyphenol oxidase